MARIAFPAGSAGITAKFSNFVCCGRFVAAPALCRTIREVEERAQEVHALGQGRDTPSAEGANNNVMPTVRAHQSVCGKGEATRLWGVHRGGLSTKIHMAPYRDARSCDPAPP